jgi:two-component system, LuxR family, sensor kinase FixL
MQCANIPAGQWDTFLNGGQEVNLSQQLFGTGVYNPRLIRSGPSPEKTHLALTEGLPGLVVAAGKPVRLMNLADPHVFPRSKSAVGVGLKFGFGFPVVIEEEILAVLEFFSIAEFQISDDLEKLMSRIGTLLGHGFERQGTAEVLRQSEEKYRALADTASDAIITIDESSKILYANPATERIFGYPVAELLDQDATILMPTYLRELHRGALTRYTETGKNT